MRNKIIILLLFMSAFVFGQSVPNTNTFTLDSVKVVVGGNSLSQCFANSVDAYFDPTYKGSKDRLSNFRNYTIPSYNYASGKYITAVVYSGYIYRSNDYGSTWLQVGTSAIWRGVAMDSTAMYQTAVVNGGYIYRSVNWGATWSAVGSSQYWNGIGVNKFSGVYQTAVSDNGIWTSSDHGSSWTQRLSGVSINSVFVSPTGQYQIAASNPGYIWISTNYGVSWTQNTAAGSKNWAGVYVTIHGSQYYGIVNGGYIWYLVPPSGTWHVSATWDDATHYWVDIAGSEDGTYRVASAATKIWYYNSSTPGWVSDYTSGDWHLDTGNGKVMVACNVSGGGYLWKSLDYGSSWTKIYSTSRAWTDIATN